MRPPTIFLLPSSFHPIVMIYKQILKCPREQTLKGIPYWSKVVAYIVHNHLLIDLACKLVYWVSISWTHSVGVIPFQFPQHPYLVQNKLSGIACTPRKGVGFLGFVVFSMVPSSSCLWKRKGPQGRVNVSCGEGWFFCECVNLRVGVGEKSWTSELEPGSE